MENSEFINERNKLLSELDSYNMDDIVNYCKKYNINMPDDEKVMLAGLHKARLYIVNPIITDEMKENSKIWLIEHGFKSSNNEIEDHYHCLICEKPYPTKKDAEVCFKNHNENEHLRWVAREVVWMQSYMYNLMKYISFIDKKYKIDD